MTVATNTHIAIDERGRPRIVGNGLKVESIAIEHIKGQTPSQIQEGWPFLTLSQIYAALAFYYDHKVEMDAEIEAGDRQYQALRAAAIASGKQPTRAELERRLRERENKA
jgi:uncharacterized protein (DUF433 family)